MKFLESPTGILTAMALAIVVFGGGLTSPIWLIVAGNDPLQAIHSGTPIVAAAIVGLVITVFLGVLATRLSKPRATAPVAAMSAAVAESRSKVVHVVVMMMFIIPFITIVLGIVLKRFIELTPG